MTTVAELRKFLEQFPDDTVVEVLAGRRGGYDCDYSKVDMSLEESFRNDWDVHGTSFEYNVSYDGAHRTLFLGEDG